MERTQSERTGWLLLEVKTQTPLRPPPREQLTLRTLALHRFSRNIPKFSKNWLQFEMDCAKVLSIGDKAAYLMLQNHNHDGEEGDKELKNVVQRLTIRDSLANFWRKRSDTQQTLRKTQFGNPT
jgi:hypothetical protein